MIMGVDHVALTCTDLDTAAQQLSESGFRVRFSQRDIPNFAGKAPLLARYQPLHSMAFCEGTSSTAIELTLHGPERPPRRASYEVLLHAEPSGSWSECESPDGIAALWRDTLGVGAVRCGAWDGSGAQFWYEPGAGAPAAVRALFVPVSDLDRSITFWKGALGLRSLTPGETDGRRWARGRFVSPVPAWCLDVVLAETAEAPQPQVLDAGGFPCLALLSTDARKDEEKLLAHGGTDSTGLFEVVIDGKGLQVLVLRGPDGELVELLQVNRGK
jgi:catechol 2,3-dioxygenase-like lactoylglutathione lyase family enzyme